MGGHEQQHRGVETGPLVFPASLHLHQTHQFQVSTKYFRPRLWHESLIFFLVQFSNAIPSFREQEEDEEDFNQGKEFDSIDGAESLAEVLNT